MSAGIYLHIPFCKSRCSYCDFATDVYRSSDVVERYVDAIVKEVAAYEPPDHLAGTHADAIYFGGGTPSLLSPGQLERILSVVNDKFTIDNGAEITMEMNPATVTPDSLAAYRELGVNRASFGVQTFDDRALRLLARGHDAADARTTFEMLRRSGYDNVSFDLIAGLPGQSIAQWEQNLDEAIFLAPEHLSLYLLEIHEGTPLAEQVRSGRQPVPDDELAAEMYEMMIDKLAAAGYGQYEISNFARPGYESRHNSKYWTLDPVLGFGVSAHSLDGRQRYANERDTAVYVSMIETGVSAGVMREEINVASEYAFLGLRLERGLNLGEYRQRFALDLLDQYRDGLARVEEAGLIQITDGQLRLTRKGKLYSNEVFSVFV